jgi:S1-C subfamily serine protease
MSESNDWQPIDAGSGDATPTGVRTPPNPAHWWDRYEDDTAWAPPGPSHVAGGRRRAEDTPPVGTPVGQPWATAPARPRPWIVWTAVGAAIVLIAVIALAGVGISNYLHHDSTNAAARTPQTGAFNPFLPPSTVPSVPPSTGPNGSGGTGGQGGQGGQGGSAGGSTSAATAGVVNVDTNLAFGTGSGAGTGMLLTDSGEVLTNNHVVSGASDIQVEVPATGRTYRAKVVGTDATDDVAVIQLDGASGLPTVDLGDSSRVKVGDAVVAVGNAGGQGGAPTVVNGSVRALDQQITVGDPASGVQEQLSGLIQTDAPLQPGDSGGPLMDSSSRVIGMDTAALVGGRFQSSNEGYAIPINHALDIAHKIEAGQSSSDIQIGAPAFLGVEIVSPSQADSVLGGSGPPSDSGAVVADVEPGTPAARAGLGSGDEIVAVDGRTVDSPTALKTIMKTHKPGDRITVSWLDSSGNRHGATVVLAAGPPA